MISFMPARIVNVVQGFLAPPSRTISLVLSSLLPTQIPITFGAWRYVRKLPSTLKSHHYLPVSPAEKTAHLTIDRNDCK